MPKLNHRVNVKSSHATRANHSLQWAQAGWNKDSIKAPWNERRVSGFLERNYSTHWEKTSHTHTNAQTLVQWLCRISSRENWARSSADELKCKLNNFSPHKTLRNSWTHQQQKNTQYARFRCSFFHLICFANLVAKSGPSTHIISYRSIEISSSPFDYAIGNNNNTQCRWLRTTESNNKRTHNWIWIDYTMIPFVSYEFGNFSDNGSSAYRIRSRTKKLLHLCTNRFRLISKCIIMRFEDFPKRKLWTFPLKRKKKISRVENDNDDDCKRNNRTQISKINDIHDLCVRDPLRVVVWHMILRLRQTKVFPFVSSIWLRLLLLVKFDSVFSFSFYSHWKWKSGTNEMVESETIWRRRKEKKQRQHISNGEWKKCWRE